MHGIFIPLRFGWGRTIKQFDSVLPNFCNGLVRFCPICATFRRAVCEYWTWTSKNYLYVVGLVWCKNHIEVKLIESPINPLAVATAQNAGSLTTSLEAKTQIMVRMQKALLNFETKKHIHSRMYYIIPLAEYEYHDDCKR